MYLRKSKQLVCFHYDLVLGGFGLVRKSRGLLALWDSPHLPSPHKAVNNNNNNISKMDPGWFS